MPAITYSRLEAHCTLLLQEPPPCVNAPVARQAANPTVQKQTLDTLQDLVHQIWCAVSQRDCTPMKRFIDKEGSGLIDWPPARYVGRADCDAE